MISAPFGTRRRLRSPSSTPRYWPKREAMFDVFALLTRASRLNDDGRR
jgi:hypothetical protein